VNEEQAAESQDFLPRDSSESEWLRRLGTRRLRSLSRDLEDSDDSDSEPEDEDDELESDSELDSESESEAEDPDVERESLLFLLRGGSSSFAFPFSSFRRSFSLASKILFAVPTGFLNSSGTSTEGFPSAFNFARSFGFSSC